MEWIEYMKSTQIVGNDLWQIGLFFLTILLSFIAGKVVNRAFSRAGGGLERRGRPVLGASFAAAGKAMTFAFFAIALKVAMRILTVPERFADEAVAATSVIIVFSIGYFAYVMVDAVDRWLESFAVKTESKLDDMLVPMVRKSLRVTIVVLVLLQIATILSDKPVTSILAGLGIGGLALALAAQDTVKNFFGSMVIFADKPFELGDRIVVDGHDGPVEEVGFRSTKIRTLEGHLVTVPNGELANKTIQNIGVRKYIRRVCSITITYDTPPEKVDRAIEIIKELLENHEGMNSDFPPRVYFDKFNDTSLNILVIYWYHPPDYWAFMQFGEWFNKELFKRYGDEDIEFAFPTQTLYLAGDENRPLNVGVVSQG